MPRIKRYVVGIDDEGRSGVLSDHLTNEQVEDGFYWRSTLWAADRFPADNALDVDLSADWVAREPAPDGFLFRALEIPPDDADLERHRAAMARLHEQVGQPVLPTVQELTRHPSMHRTRTLDFTTCVSGEIHLVTDRDEVRMTPGDTVVLRGGNHAWSNRSDRPCLLAVVMISATF